MKNEYETGSESNLPGADRNTVKSAYGVEPSQVQVSRDRSSTLRASWTSCAFLPNIHLRSTLAVTGGEAKGLPLQGGTSAGALDRRVAAPAGGLHCPECGSIIYSRRHERCGVCNHPLPPELLFSREEAQRIESLLSSERTRHRAWMDKAFRQAMAPSQRV